MQPPKKTSRGVSSRPAVSTTPQTIPWPSLSPSTPNLDVSNPRSHHTTRSAGSSKSRPAPCSAETNPASSSQPWRAAAAKVVIVGNPGAGKSTILNTLLGHATFRSGTSLGHGMTRMRKCVTMGGTQYIDTPGLDDVELRKEAAREIGRALDGPGNVRLVFVVTLEAGRVRPADVSTVKIVLEAVRRSGIAVDGNFSLIFNKCDQSVMRALEFEAGAEWSVLEPFCFVASVTHVCTLPLELTATGKDDELLGMAENLQRFVAGAPRFEVKGEYGIKIDVRGFDEVQDELHEVLMELENARKGGERHGDNRNKGGGYSSRSRSKEGEKSLLSKIAKFKEAPKRIIKILFL